MARSKANVVQMPPPLTQIQTQAISMAGMEEAIVETMTTHAALLQKYHEVWYQSAHTWGFTNFLGIGMLKCPNDLWVYQELLTRLRPQTVLECGTFAGGSALWFAALMDLLGIDGGEVLTIDIDPTHRAPQARHPRVTFYGGSSVDPALARDVLDRVQHPLLVVLDSDHAAAHVRAELELYAPACHVGDWLVVEDTNVAWLHDRGARGGLEDYLIAHPKEWRQDIICEHWLLTMNPGAWLERMNECNHK